ncbi:hypothetical protein 8F11_16 [uncultured Caudovirales phage]|uniref:Uncharacterized protein n=1 Tax=uncultured Caudovirales phage TaxID=2100421 RepID=A0A2H4J7J6_9CAUD|nr:hypothetical protein 8F11_16 [uncultured Caudovirales phage]
MSGLISAELKAKLIAAVEAVINAEDNSDEEIERIDDLLDICDEYDIDPEIAWVLHRRAEGLKGS